jgi:hypothetical protein
MLSDLTHIPRIMRRRGWNNGARLLDLWFSRRAAAAPHYAPADTSTIKMDSWVLTFPRAQRLYDAIMRDRVWANPAAQSVIAQLLRRKGLLTAGGCSFGPTGGSAVSQDPDYVNFRVIDESAAFDDMTAALGAFAFRVLVAGTVAPQTAGAGYDVEISRVGVYIRDSFDFEGDQYLGCWSDNPDGFSPLMPPGAVTPYGLSLSPPAFSPVGNRDFREWRRQTGRGGDFLVYSDVKWTSLTTPDRFTVR